LKSPFPFTNAPIIDGQDVKTGAAFAAVNPATEEPFADVVRAGPREIEMAVASARKAFLSWSQTPVADRQRYLARLLEQVRRAHEDIARLIATEQGKPVGEARAVDIVPAADTLRYLSRHAGELLAERPIDYAQILFAHKKGSTRFEPLGVLAVVTPWNFPFGIPFVEIAACLAAGNTVVLKPASATALTGLAVGDLCRRAGLPPGVVNVVTAGGADTNVLVEHPGIAKVLFTGSVPTGVEVMQRAAKNLTGVVLELGGKDAAVVAADADLDRTAAGLVWGAFVNAGQTCGSVERVYVVKDVADELLSKIVARTKMLRLGDPLSTTTDMGPSRRPASGTSSKRISRTPSRKARRFSWEGSARGRRGGGSLPPSSPASTTRCTRCATRRSAPSCPSWRWTLSRKASGSRTTPHSVSPLRAGRARAARRAGSRKSCTREP